MLNFLTISVLLIMMISKNIYSNILISCILHHRLILASKSFRKILKVYRFSVHLIQKVFQNIIKILILKLMNFLLRRWNHLFLLSWKSMVEKCIHMEGLILLKLKKKSINAIIMEFADDGDLYHFWRVKFESLLEISG